MAGHRYWKLLSLPPRNSTTQAIAEIQLRETVSGANFLTGGTASAHAFTATTGLPSFAVDGNALTNWSIAGEVSASGVDWWAYDLGVGVTKLPVEMVLTGNSNAASQAPVNIILAYSDDGILWTNYYSGLIVGTGSLTWIASESKTISISNNILAPKVLPVLYSGSPDFNITKVVGPSGLLSKSLFNDLLNPSAIKRAPFVGGTYKVEGSTTVLAVPAARIVNLYDQKSGILVAVAKTNSTGLFSFTGLQSGTYSVVGVNAEGVQNSVIFAHVTAVPM